LAVSLFISCVTSIVFVFIPVQPFAGYGIVKRLILPLTYTLAALALVLPSRGRFRLQAPAWFIVGLFSLLVAIFWGLRGVSRPSPTAYLEDLLLVGGFLGLFSLAASIRRWDESSAQLLILALTLSAVVALMCGLQVGPYSAIVAPGGAILIYMGIVGRGTDRWLALAGIAIIATMLRLLASSPNPSTAATSEVGACLACVLYALAPRRTRPSLAILGLFALALYLLSSGTVQLMQGEYRGIDDVTLAQRGCEASVVFQTIGRAPAFPPPQVIGLGLGSTVDLTQCPDTDTLQSAGRDLRAVDDVHLLSSWIYMKLGMLGLTWVGLILAATVRSTLDFRRVHRPSALRLLALMCALCGMVSALPAATNFFSNPLLPVSLGILWSLRDVGGALPDSTEAAADADRHAGAV